MTFIAKAKPKPSLTHKKRTGTHHKHTQHYVKHYWPYIPIVAVIGLGMLVNTIWTSQTHVLGTSADLSQVALVDATNAQRSHAHQPNLSLNAQLSAAAQQKADDMVARNYWSHTTPDGRAPWTFITNSGYNYQKAGENLAYGFTDASTTITAWMNSPEHRKNILNTAYSEVGFGVATSKNFVSTGPETVVVALYALPASAGAEAPTVVQTAGEAQVRGSEVETSQIARIQLLSGSSTSAGVVTISLLASLAVAIFLIRHARIWHRVLVRSEAMIIHHPLFDIAAVSFAVAGFVVIQSAGFVL